MKRALTVLFVLCLICTSQQISTPDSDSYVAAVLEYHFSRNTSTNLQNYLFYIQQAAEQYADILVFPEMTLTRGGNVRVPIHGLLKDYRIPALHPHLFDEILVALSSAARNHGIYLVVNVQEEMDCRISPEEYCPEQKTYIFNTNVVFDRSGAVIDRYRKINLFNEYTRSPALLPELGVFSTDFGVRFGHFVCFDLMFQVPATQVVQKYNLTDIIFSTMWFSEMPFLTAVEIQESYAYTTGVNFLAAGANNVKVGSAGSGIYSGKAGALISIMPGEPKTQLLVSRVPKRPGYATFDHPGPLYDDPTAPQLLLNKDVTLKSAASRPLRAGFQEFTLTDRDVSCVFRVRLRNKTTDTKRTIPHFRAFVKDGTNTYAHRQMGILFCAVVACENEDADSCPYRFSKDEKFTEFEELEIKMTTYPKQYNNTLSCDNIVYYPTSLRYNKFPLDTQDFTYIESTQEIDLNNEIVSNEVTKRRAEIFYRLISPQDELVAFSIWGRAYLRDVNEIIDSSEEDVNNSIAVENLIFSFADE
ncbi:unnamed protein product [Chilo suppressalis]|uniref:CN hydrolase domain-containing protein n=1 Tax=Chilo suppressalis TaxID=168631 RepID=A0ABN8AZ15_CHISP|nr:unnamed protein product [Chilo suppressalis]